MKNCAFWVKKSIAGEKYGLVGVLYTTKMCKSVENPDLARRRRKNNDFSRYFSQKTRRRRKKIEKSNLF